MNVLGKIIAIIAFVLMILLILNYKSILPFFDKLVFGGNAKSPFQIGALYVNQIERDNPYKKYTGSTNPTITTYGEYISSTSGVKQKKSRITVEKIDTGLYLTTESVPVPNQNPNIHIWLTNTSTVTDQTKYIDFGRIKQEHIASYGVQVQQPNLSLAEYKHVMIIDTTTYTIYGHAVLGN